jgi:hypothetical protein
MRAVRGLARARSAGVPRMRRHGLGLQSAAGRRECWRAVSMVAQCGGEYFS